MARVIGGTVLLLLLAFAGVPLLERALSSGRRGGLVAELNSWSGILDYAQIGLGALALGALLLVLVQRGDVRFPWAERRIIHPLGAYGERLRARDEEARRNSGEADAELSEEARARLRRMLGLDPPDAGR